MAPRHFLTDADVTPQEQAEILTLAAEMKADPAAFSTTLSNRILGMIFEKNSTRTRVSFEAGIRQLGGSGIFLSSRDIQLSRGEPVSDTGQVLSRYVDLLMIRTFGHTTVQGLAKASRVPVINGLDDTWHPCQILADLQTLHEAYGRVLGAVVAYVGDGNNMAHSWMLGGAMAGVSVRIICPKGFEPNADIVALAQSKAIAGAQISVCHDLREGVAGADAVYTDVWASMGQEDEAHARRESFMPYQVNSEVMAMASAEAIFLHCLPAHRGEEVSAAVIDGSQSRVFDQAENRLHAQKALMAWLSKASS